MGTQKGRPKGRTARTIKAHSEVFAIYEELKEKLKDADAAAFVGPSYYKSKISERTGYNEDYVGRILNSKES